jgi:hypothetical protein
MPETLLYKLLTIRSLSKKNVILSRARRAGDHSSDISLTSERQAKDLDSSVTGGEEHRGSLKNDKSKKRIFWIYLALLGLLSVLLAGYTTSTYGSGVGTDGAIQMSTADNLLKGRGFIDYTGAPFVKWPPLYPVLLASLSRLTGLDTFAVGWYLNLLLMGVIVWLSGALLYDCFKGELIWAYLGSLVVASSVSILSVVANIGTDPLFIALTLACLLVADRYLVGGGQWSLIGMGLLACLASLQRLPGVTLIATGAILILYMHRHHIVRGILLALIFSVLAVLPLAAWMIVHNYIQNRTLAGVYIFARTVPLFNLQNSLDKIVHWFVPYAVIARLPSLAIIGIGFLVLALVSRRKDWKRLADRLLHPPVLASLIFSVLYLAFLVLTINSDDTKFPLYDRYQIVIFVPVLILIFATLQALVIERLENRRDLARLVIVAAFALWMIYPFYSLYKYVGATRLEGEVTYNLYNTRSMRQSEIVRVLQQIGNESGQTIYSNYQAAAWFYTRDNVTESPRGSIMSKINVDALLKAYQGWPGDKPGYLVWFLPNDYKHVLGPVDLARLAELDLIYKGKDGEIYRVRAR